MFCRYSDKKGNDPTYFSICAACRISTWNIRALLWLVAWLHGRSSEVSIRSCRWRWFQYTIASWFSWKFAKRFGRRFRIFRVPDRQWWQQSWFSHGHVDVWELYGSMDVRRRTDFLLFSVCLPLLSACATDCIDMGSDHRAVTVYFHFLACAETWYKTTIQNEQGLEPEKTANGFAETYQHFPRTALCNDSPVTVSDLEQCVLEAVEKHDRLTKHAEKFETYFFPWKRPSFQKMFEERRTAKCRSERTNLSQQIRTHIRRYMRARRNIPVRHCSAGTGNLLYVRSGWAPNRQHNNLNSFWETYFNQL